MDYWLPSRVRYVWAHVYCCISHELGPGSCDGIPYQAADARRPDPAAPRAWLRTAWLRADLTAGWGHLRAGYPRRFARAALVIMVRGPHVRRGPAGPPVHTPGQRLIGPWTRADLGRLSWADAARRLHRQQRALKADAYAASIIVGRYLDGLPERPADWYDQRADADAERERIADEVVRALRQPELPLPGDVDPYHAAGLPNPWH